MLYYGSLPVSTKKFGDLGMTFQLILVFHCGNAEPILTLVLLLGWPNSTGDA